jgi:hypothetical protein
MSEQLGTLYSDPAIKDFGSALRKALRMREDYASLIDFENAESPDAFAEALRKFLRRFEALARRRHLRRPSEENLERLAKLVDENEVRLVRAALISHALVRSPREEEETEEG